MSLREAVNGTTVADRILFSGLILGSLLGFAFITDILPEKEGITIEVAGKVTHRYTLDTDRSVPVTGHNNSSLMVEIKNKEVRVMNATCPNKLCEQQGWIYSGAIICLPGRIIITVGGPKARKGRTIDAITG